MEKPVNKPIYGGTITADALAVAPGSDIAFETLKTTILRVLENSGRTVTEPLWAAATNAEGGIDVRLYDGDPQ